MIYLGIDPGQKGGLALLRDSGEAICVEPMPETVHALCAMVGGYYQACGDGLRMVVELAQPMPNQGIVSSFTYGRHFGAFEALAAAHRLPYHEVRPAVWKKAMGLNSDKLESVSLTVRLWPQIDLTPGRRTKPSDGMAEALLIAEWARRQRL